MHDVRTSLEVLAACISEDDIRRKAQHLCFLLVDVHPEGLDNSPPRLLARLQPLRSAFFWLPSAFLEGDSLDATKAAALALTYAAALCFEQAYANVQISLPEESIRTNAIEDDVSQLNSVLLFLGGPFLTLTREAFQTLCSFHGPEEPVTRAVETVEQVLKATLLVEPQ